MFEKNQNRKAAQCGAPSKQRPTFWRYEKGNDLEGKIVAFDSFEHDLYGVQNTGHWFSWVGTVYAAIGIMKSSFQVSFLSSIPKATAGTFLVVK